MKKGKVILGLVAVVVTAGSALAFKVAKTFSNNKVYVITTSGHCLKCTGLRTGSLSNHITACKATNGSSYKGKGSNKYTFYKATSGLINHTCLTPTTKTTKNG